MELAGVPFETVKHGLHHFLVPRDLRCHDPGRACTELNDPLEQRRRFESLQELYGAADEEQNPIDEDYIRAMAYGMPPNGGFGTGVDRLVMLLTDNHHIREVLLYPHLREKSES